MSVGAVLKQYKTPEMVNLLNKRCLYCKAAWRTDTHFRYWLIMYHDDWRPQRESSENYVLTIKNVTTNEEMDKMTEYEAWTGARTLGAKKLQHARSKGYRNIPWMSTASCIPPNRLIRGSWGTKNKLKHIRSNPDYAWRRIHTNISTLRDVRHISKGQQIQLTAAVNSHGSRESSLDIRPKNDTRMKNSSKRPQVDVVANKMHICKRDE